MSVWAERWFLAGRFGRAQLLMPRSHAQMNRRFDFCDQRKIRRVARRDEAAVPTFRCRDDTTPPTRTRRQNTVVTNLMGARGRN